MRNRIFHILLFAVSVSCFAQESDTLSIGKMDSSLKIQETKSNSEYNPLAPSKAAFYSAVLPGLGQAYNKRYWKIPIVYGGIVAGIYFYKQQDADYNRFRNAYKRRLAGFKDDEFYGSGNEPFISNDRLINAQRSAQKNKSVSLMVAIGFYLLNIVDANVDAHLQQYEVREDLSLQPSIDVNPLNNQTQYGLVLKYRLN